MFSRIIELLKKNNDSVNKINNSNLLNNSEIFFDYRIRSNMLLDSALNSKLSMTEKWDPSVSPELIVSLTTYDKRIHDVHLVIESIAQQAVRPNRIILWLDEEEFNLPSIPKVLHRQIERGLEVKFCPNYRSYKKLLPTLELFSEANIITIDDDILYPHYMIELLLREHARFPDYVVGHRAHKMRFDEDSVLLPYDEWDLETGDDKPGEHIFITTGAGALFPAKILSDEVFNHEAFLSICPNADDIWFNAMTQLNGKLSKKITDDRKYFSKFLLIPDGQDIALHHRNLAESENDSQLGEVFTRYELLGFE